MWGISTEIVLKQVQLDHLLPILGGAETEMDEVVSQATNFTGACYGSKQTNKMLAIPIY